MKSKVIDYIVEEVQRQGHDVRVLDGIERVAGMAQAWAYALTRAHGTEAGYNLRVEDIEHLGMYIEPVRNWKGFRRTGVRVGNRICPEWEKVRPLLEDLFKRHGEEALLPFVFYRQLLEIHPFVDGNGRTGKVVLNWLNGTLLDPTFPPADFWGYPITNP
jgi:Fic/DOC family